MADAANQCSRHQDEGFLNDIKIRKYRMLEISTCCVWGEQETVAYKSNVGPLISICRKSWTESHQTRNQKEIHMVCSSQEIEKSDWYHKLACNQRRSCWGSWRHGRNSPCRSSPRLWYQRQLAATWTIQRRRSWCPFSTQFHTVTLVHCWIYQQRSDKHFVADLKAARILIKAPPQSTPKRRRTAKKYEPPLSPSKRSKKTTWIPVSLLDYWCVNWISLNFCHGIQSSKQGLSRHGWRFPSSL